MITIDIQNEIDYDLPALNELIKAAQKILDDKKIVLNVEIGLKIVKPDSIRELNKKYRNIDKATDVLSFPIYDMLPEKSDEPVLLGDIVVCPEAAQDDFIKLFSHSVLHLIGIHHK
jgi:probable rRNA maturation factor